VKHLVFHEGTGSDDHCLAETIIESTHQAVVVLDKQRRRVLYANPAFVTVTGYTTDEIKGKSLAHFRSDRHNDAFYRQIWSSLENRGYWSGEIWGRRKNGEEYPGLHTISPICESKLGRVTGYVSIFCDITAIKRQQSSLGDLAYQDPLTGLPNRLLLVDRLQHALRTHTRNNAQMAVLFIDLDNFKNINDTLGHAVGDQLLQSAAGRLQSILRSDDTVARLGGDEFVIIAESCPSRLGIRQIAEKALRKITEPLHIEHHDVSVQASIGIAVFPQDGADVDTILQAADQAMYQAKMNKGGYCFFGDQRQS
jgi:diguanylate cyclase (GGDEF)-like protein/PAS domain S-box-containing protein